MEQAVIVSLTALLMLAGLAGCILPLLPGSPLILAGALLYAWHDQFTSVSWQDLLVLAILAGTGQALEYIATAFGARRYGASRWGMLGAFLGGMVGLLTASIIGLIAGAFAGAVILEMIKGGEFKNSLRIGYGTFIGFLCGTVGKIIIAIIMVGYFILQARS